jgi:hypothetical protein
VWLLILLGVVFGLGILAAVEVLALISGSWTRNIDTVRSQGQ